MASAKTKLEDVFVPEVWEQYFIERTAEMAMFAGSGIVSADPTFNALAASGGKTVEMPFWTDLAGTRQIIGDSASFETKKIVSSKDTARIHNDGDAWSTTLLADLLAGSRGMDAIVDLVAEYWARQDEQLLISTVKGVLAEFDSIAGDPNLLKIAVEITGNTTADNVLTGFTFIDAKQKLGDQKDRLTAIAVHSEVEADLLKQGLIEFVPQEDGKQQLAFFQGLRVIKDDDLPKRAGTTSGSVYTSVLFGAGAIARGFAPLTTPVDGGFGTEGVERSRVPLAHDSVMINRRRHILHPRGVAWVEEPEGLDSDEQVADGGPTNEQLENALHWTKKYEAKNIRIVGIMHNLANQIPAES